MDAFETRMQFLNHLRRLTSAAQSINKVVSFLLKHSSHTPGSRSRSVTASHSESDLWECILEELEKSSINAKINIFYMLDSLLDQSLALGIESYRELVKDDLEKVVELTVPRTAREGVLNRMSAMQVLNSWKMRRLLPVPLLESLLDSLQSAQFPASSSSSSQTQSFSRNDILRRIEDDRERHKRLRERIWVLPVPSLLDLSAEAKLSTVLGTAATNSPASPASPAATEPKLVSLAGYTKEDTNGNHLDEDEKAKETALDVEFEQAWDSVGDSYSLQIDEIDLRAMEQENLKCFT